MHRSGTSLLGSILQHLGVALPGETIPGDEHNPEGYFEWKAVVGIQERLLIDLERWWPSEDGTQALPDHWLSHPASEEARQQLTDLLKEESGRQIGPWAIKDPRSSRLLPLWNAIASNQNIPLQLILAVRHPAEVSASLVRRDGPLTGMDSSRAQKLWWRHNLEVVQGANQLGIPLTVVDFDSWFSSPSSQIERLVSALGMQSLSTEQRDAACRLIRPEHRRSQAMAAELTIDPDLLLLHRRLLKLPFPDHWPSAAPPIRLCTRNAQSAAALSLASDPNAWDAWLQQHRHFPAPRHPGILHLARDPRLHVCGQTWHELTPHLLLQHLPLEGIKERKLDSERSETHLLRLIPTVSCPERTAGLNSLAINLELPPPERATHWLNHLRAQEIVFDPDPARVKLLRTLGLAAWWLDPAHPANGWLQQTAAQNPSQWASELGLTAPAQDHLILLGHAGNVFDQGLAKEAQHEPDATPGIQYLPGWPDLIIPNPATGLLRAGWLANAARCAARLVHSAQAPVPAEWRLLEGLRCSPFALGDHSSPTELRARHRGQISVAEASERPSPALVERFDWRQLGDTTSPANAAVVVSLFNYGDRITSALDSVLQQRQVSLELIVIDDASEDAGALVVEQWMKAVIQRGNHPFRRVWLAQHQQNAGLAAARNTAFSAAESEWCFVLDADNALCPDAVHRCLRVAEGGSESLAVVHPLLAVEVEEGRPDEQRSLVGGGSWQRDQFISGNYIDAMALIRRSAWKQVGGYTHIEGGWEDFDFWCKLVESGFHGVQYPAVLAIYRSHADSMIAKHTQRLLKPLSRCLQARHPWLNLPLGEAKP